MAFYNYELKDRIRDYKFVQYIRRSSKDNEDKQVRSLTGQIEDIDIQVIKPLNLTDIILLQESKSAFKDERPCFEKMMELLKNGQRNAVMVWHPNRIARNYEDGGRFVQLMSDGKLKIVITPYAIFENTPRDKEYLMTEFTRATRDSDDKSEVIKRGNRTKLNAGYIPSGRLPEGLIHIKNEQGEMIQTHNPQQVPLLQKAIKKVTNQIMTPMEALDYLNKDLRYKTLKTRRGGGQSLSKSGWYKILSSPIYIGEIHRTEGIFKTGFPRIIDKEQSDKLEIILNRKMKRNRSKKEWAYTGEITCGDCGGAITMEEKWQIICPVCKTKFHRGKQTSKCPTCNTFIDQMKNSKILHYVWLHCGKQKKTTNGIKCPQTTIQLKDFEKQVDTVLANMQIPEEYTQWALEWIHLISNEEIQDRSATQTNLQKRFNTVQSQLDELLNVLLSRHVTEEEYQNKKELLLLEKQELKEKLDKTSKRADDWMEHTERTFMFATHARYWFEHGTTEQKRTILKTLGSNLTLKDKKLFIQERKPFIEVKKMKEIADLQKQSFEPTENVLFEDKKTMLNSSIPQLLPD